MKTEKKQRNSSSRLQRRVRAETAVQIHIRTRFGEEFYYGGLLPNNRIIRLIDFAKKCVAMLDTERPIVTYNPGFAAWQQGKLGRPNK